MEHFLTDYDVMSHMMPGLPRGQFEAHRAAQRVYAPLHIGGLCSGALTDQVRR